MIYYHSYLYVFSFFTTTNQLFLMILQEFMFSLGSKGLQGRVRCIILLAALQGILSCQKKSLYRKRASCQSEALFKRHPATPACGKD